jgi:threonine dehydrogenase-like Zn-dependent dehydrogenase
VVFECSGRAEAAESAIDQLDFAGVCVLVGTGHDLPRINHNRVIVLENSIIGAYNYDAGGFAPALALLASGDMPIHALVEPSDISLDDLLPVMRRCAAGELPGKVMVRPVRSEEKQR